MNKIRVGPGPSEPEGAAIASASRAALIIEFDPVTW
jgi:hypothetical protein